jgi:glycosyltransferase involved in cell wall biosynthesis
MSEPSLEPTIRLLIILEGNKISGPAKNVLEFCRVATSLDGPPFIAVSIATFVRVQESKDGLAPNQLHQAAAAAGVQVHSIEERFPFDPRAISGLRKLVNLLNPDIIQTHHVKSHFLVRLSRVWRNHSWIAFHHGYTNEGTRMWLYDQLDRWSLRGPARIVTVCGAFREQLSARGVPHSRITVLHNAVSPDWLHGNEKMLDPGAGSAESSDTREHEQERTVLAVGRLSAEKGFRDLVVAMGQLRGLRPDLFVRLVILGDGPDRSRIERAVHDLDLEDRVALSGHVRDVRPYYRAADMLAIASVSEGSPNVLLEAMAAGLPVVATSVGGIPEIVTDGDTALLVEPCNPAAMASAIDRLLSDGSLSTTLADNAYRLIMMRYSPQYRARFLTDFYGQVFRGRANMMTTLSV